MSLREGGEEDSRGSESSCFKTTELSVEISEGEMWLTRATDLKDRLSKRLEIEGGGKYSRILDGCGQDMWLRCTECSTRKRGRTHCKKRYCPLCAPSYAAARVDQYAAAVERMQWPLHLTLTIANVADISTATLKKLLHNFRKLRQKNLWKKTVRGGYASLEVVNTGHGWHPHLHVIADAEWIALKTPMPKRWMTQDRKAELYQSASAELGAVWAKTISQPTASLRIRRKHGGDAGARQLAVEALKYSVKAGDLLTCRERATDLLIAMEKVRMFRSFGKNYGKLEAKKKTPCKCEKCDAENSFRPEEVLEKKELHGEWSEHKRDKRARRRK